MDVSNIQWKPCAANNNEQLKNSSFYANKALDDQGTIGSHTMTHKMYFSTWEKMFDYVEHNDANTICMSRLDRKPLKTDPSVQ